MQDIEKELIEVTDKIRAMLKEYDDSCIDLYNEISEYAKGYTESSVRYLLTLPKTEQMLILRSLNPVVDHILIKLDEYRVQMDELSRYALSLRNKGNGLLSLNKSSKFDSLPN